MKAYTVRCPDCRAQLKAEMGLSACSYCGASIMVEGGSSTDLEAQKETLDRPPEPRMPELANSSPPASLILAASLFVLGLTALGVVFSSSDTKPIPSTSREPTGAGRGQAGRLANAPEDLVMEFEAHHPVLARVDADDVDDILSYFEGPDDAFFVAALNGSDGGLFWRSDAVPGLVDGAEPRVIVGGEVVFAATGTGELTAYSKRDGGTLWSVRLAEVVKQIFEVDEETVQVLLTDGQLVHLGLESGSVMAAPDSSAEREDALPDTNGQKSRSGVRMERFSGSRTFGDVDANLLAIAEDGSFQVAMGKRRKGTPTPMLIRYEGVVKVGSRGELEEVWRTPVPGVEPMKARAPMTLDAHLHASRAFVCAAYSTLEKIGVMPSRLAAFDMQDGRRLWAIRSPRDLRSSPSP